MRSHFSKFAFSICFFLCTTAAQAAVPSLVTYSGRLTDGTGWGETTIVDLTIRLFPCQCPFDVGCAAPCPEDGDGPLWTTTHLNVPVSDGYFTVQLGTCDAIGVCSADPSQWSFPSELPAQVWVDVVLNGAVLEPRRPLGSVPYAMSAGNGVPVGAIMSFFGDTAPPGWLIADGSTIDAAQNPAYLMLVAHLRQSGEDYQVSGNEDAAILPDLRGLFLRGQNRDRPASTGNPSPGDDSIGRYEQDQMQSHKHNDQGHDHQVQNVWDNGALIIVPANQCPCGPAQRACMRDFASAAGIRAEGVGRLLLPGTIQPPVA